MGGLDDLLPSGGGKIRELDEMPSLHRVFKGGLFAGQSAGVGDGGGVGQLGVVCGLEDAGVIDGAFPQGGEADEEEGVVGGAGRIKERDADVPGWLHATKGHAREECHGGGGL